VPTAENRRELARFLRTRRERITPAQVGLPANTRRRIRGLRREEVAVLAGLSPTWYTYLEQARDIRPSPEVLNSLADVLQLDEDERQYLHQLALGHVETVRPVTPSATSTIPIVMAGSYDPVGRGLVASLARPGGNTTGVSTLGAELPGKRLELLKETVPQSARVAVLANPAAPGYESAMHNLTVAAQALQLHRQKRGPRRKTARSLAISGR